MKWLVWGISVIAYVLAVVNRSSFSALGATAQEHFGVEATVLSIFVTVQLVVYAAAQIPVGISLDRWGAPVLVSAGMLSMGTGQLLMGNTDTVALAIIARIMVGAGDACIFVSMVRLVADWFLPRQIPIINQLSGNIGQLGQIIAVAPLLSLVEIAGWRTGFTTLAIMGLGFAILSAFTLRDTPASQTVAERLRRKPSASASFLETVETAHTASPVTEALPIVGPGSEGIFKALFKLVQRPGIRLAFWMHMSVTCSLFNFTLLWGTPFVTGGLGLPQSTASLLITTVIVSILVFGFFAGPLLSRFAAWRVHMVVANAILIYTVWAIIILVPGRPPLGLLYTLAIVLGIGGPVSMSAFDVVRSHAPYSQRSAATGIANMGGYIGAFTLMLAVGLVLDAQGAGSPETYSLQPFKVAMSAQLVLGAVSLVMILIEYPKAKRYLLSKGISL